MAHHVGLFSHLGCFNSCDIAANTYWFELSYNTFSPFHQDITAFYVFEIRTVSANAVTTNPPCTKSVHVPKSKEESNLPITNAV